MKTRSFFLATLFALAATFAPLSIDRQPTQIRERLALVKVDAAGNRVDAGRVEQITLRGAPDFDSKLAMARAVIGRDESRPYIAQAHALIVNAGETKLRDCFIATSCTSAQAWKFHGIGTSAVGAAETDTGCTTELTTQYNPDNTRATGSQTNNGANIYRTVGTNTMDATAAVTEWCLQDQAAVGGGNMWSRITFSTINLASGDSLQTTYDLTIE